jgi:hypothetical protein
MDLKAKPYRNLDESAQVGIARFYDAAKNDAMGNERRPGLGGPTSNRFVDLGTGKAVDTVYEWEHQGWIVAISGGRVFKVVANGAVTEITGATLLEGKPATFADFGTSLYMANGGRIIKWTATNVTCAYIADPDAPATVTHIGFIDQYLIALDAGSDQIHFADVAAPDTWLGEFFTAESLKDKSQALHIAWREIVIFGSKSIEYWGSTGNATAPFQRFEGSNTERGCIAPYTVQQIDNTWFFLDHERRVVKLAGRDPQVVSNPFDSELQKMDTVSDARGLHVHPNGETFYVLTFPAEGRTFAYDYKRDVWAEWSYWNNDTGSRDAFLGQTSCYMRTWNKHLIGSRTDGKVYYTSKSYHQDGGNPAMWEVWTGWEGNGDWRFVAELMLKIRRGDGAALTTPEPILELYYRDRNANPNDDEAQWIGPKHVNLGQLGEMDHVYRIRRLGRYRTRQYRFRCAENVPIVLSEAAEI